ncbi:hypothetical protein K439DRAFT_1614756 [Ramaria rubella]|nr:hypothetical protein K439DRAFT_1614756 [Ramaria rubella]
MRLITIASIVFSAAQVAISIPVRQLLARRAPDGIVVIPIGNPVVQRDDNDEELLTRELTHFSARKPKFSGGRDNLSTRSLREGERPRPNGPRPLDPFASTRTTLAESKAILTPKGPRVDPKAHKPKPKPKGHKRELALGIHEQSLE